MIKAIIPFVFFMLIYCPVHSQTIWEGPKITFAKSNNADPTLEENQDRITDSVWITRGTSQGIYNISLEESYVINSSPFGTEWAFGTTDELPGLTFNNWQTAVASNPPAMVGQDMVLHLISEDIYMNIKFLSWSIGAAGGGFSYERSTDLSSHLVGTDRLSGNISVFPNPSPRETVWIRYDSDINSPLIVSVYGPEGNLYFNKIWPVQTGINSWNLNLSRFRHTVYLIQFRQGPRMVTRKVVLE